MNIPHECPDSLCFNQDECSCAPTATSSTKPQSTTTEPPSTTTKQPSTTTELPSTTTTTTTEQPSTTTKPPSTVTEPPTTTTKSIFTTTENPTPTIIDFSSTTTELTCSSDCPYVDDPTDECSKYYYCSAEGNLEQACPPSFCFDQSACQCLPSQTTSIPITCSAECPYADDPTDGCSKYYYCTAEGNFEQECPLSLCFDESACQCVAPETTIAPITCPAGCPYADDPTDDCSKYYLCTENGNIQQECPTSFCFDQSACQCMPSEGTTESYVTTAVSITCSDECPYADDPTDDCSKYYYCTEEGNIEQECPSSFCFDQSACLCLPVGTTSVPITCPAECPYADDPNDECTKVHVKCRPSGGTTETYQTTAVSITCSDECPYADDPTDDCSKYFLCDGNGGLIPYDCPGTLCFNQDVCQCR
ncbi:hypothetical protein Anas_12583 [Armadillidium nasatum]|uniref:Chitin-binding type-2 domain-containing protein n=1 Tax=Armadillidium nasatum TaxID=96803 RepID=A0A5N5TC24_9CRUS|nr:hypothetical protein Anas_12583 [Armadillidium nasatum]